MEVRAAELAKRLAVVERERAEIVAALQGIRHEQQACWTEKAEGIDQAPATAAVTVDSSTASKIALFKSLFRGRPDVFPRRWENPRAGKSGYSPACRNEWVRGICAKPKVRCSECTHQAFPPVSDNIIRSHLLGRDVSTSSRSHQDFIAGVYPLLADETCWFLVADLDKQSWAKDAGAFLGTCRAKGVPAALERSRSGNGGHVWIFFSDPVPVAEARKLGALLITETMERHPEIGFNSYRPILSKPGHHAGRRLRQPHRTAVAERSKTERQQHVRRRRASPPSRSMGISVMRQANNSWRGCGSGRAGRSGGQDPWSPPAN